ncbi:Exodeoxyribonuclease III [Corynebacterium camporealensis]|nr:Exodeoxyribonuclease III [Corynebacterium camporealensis]
MRIASWNINSVRTRAHRAINLLQQHDIDVLCLQETKVADDKFPTEPFEEAGYHVSCFGLNQWNGVAIISREKPEEVWTSFPGQPGFAKDPEAEQSLEARAIGARIRGIEIWSLYVPNGREITDRHYAYKLQFLYQLARYAESRSNSKFLLTGDFNIAPRDTDVWDIEAFRGKTHVTEPERAAFQMLLEAGLTEVTRAHTLDKRYTYFDYKASVSLKTKACASTSSWPVQRLPMPAPPPTSISPNGPAIRPPTTAFLIADYDLPDFDSVR